MDSVLGGERSFLPGHVGSSTLWSLRNGASSTSLSFGVSFHPHTHPTEDPVDTTIPTTAQSISERVCDEFKVTELEKTVLSTRK